MHKGKRDQTLATPWTVIRTIEKAIGRPFDIDVCAAADTAKAPRFFTEEDDGLAQRWSGTCWCNPPFNDIASWVDKAIRSYGAGHVDGVVMIMPSNRTEQAWFHRMREMERAGRAALVFPRRRINYEGGPSSAPFPSCLWGIGPEWLLDGLRRVELLPRDGLFD